MCSIASARTSLSQLGPHEGQCEAARAGELDLGDNTYATLVRQVRESEPRTPGSSPELSTQTTQSRPPYQPMR